MKRALVLGCLGALGCAPAPPAPTSLVSGTQVLAVRGEPPEVGAGQSVAFDLLVASPGGTVSSDAAWGVCVTPAPAGDEDVAGVACISGDGTAPAGDGASVTVTLPGDACSLFGPDPPPGGLRPPDPDVTGGYYVPVRAQVPGAGVAFGLERLTCDLANAPAAVAHQYATEYTLNRNPALTPLTARVGGASVSLGAIPAGAHVVLTAGWTADSPETFVVLDPSGQGLLTQGESMQLSWHATGGTFDADRTGRGPGDPALTAPNGWTAPASAGVVHLWVVLRDDRGGVDFASYDLRVAP